MELSEVLATNPVLVKRIEQWIEERIEIIAAIDEADNSTDLWAYVPIDERRSLADEDAGEILEWLLTEMGLWPEQQGAPDGHEADPAPGG